MSAVPFPLANPASPNKENGAAPFSILPALGKPATKGRKRTITLVNGDTVDLAAALPISANVVESMRLRIIQLEDQLAESQGPAKRARASKAADDMPVASSSSSGPSAAALKAEEKKRKIQTKKVFDRLKKECKSDGCKFQGAPKTIKVEEVYEQSDFQAIFGGKGVLVQPTPTNKPGSTVTIIQFNTPAQVEAFFGDELKQLKGYNWTRGGAPSFSKSIKLGAVDVSIQSFEVNYSKNTMKCGIKFEVAQEGGGGYDSDMGYYGGRRMW